MWFLIIVQIILGYTVARCPRSESAMRRMCLIRWERCSFMKCYCNGRYQKTTSYYCSPRRRWRRVGKKQKCSPCRKKKCICSSKRRKCFCRRVIKFRPIKFRPYRPRRGLRTYRFRRSFRSFRG